jgi:hypothetical protein
LGPFESTTGERSGLIDKIPKIVLPKVATRMYSKNLSSIMSADEEKQFHAGNEAATFVSRFFLELNYLQL